MPASSPTVTDICTMSVETTNWFTVVGSPMPRTGDSTATCEMKAIW